MSKDPWTDPDPNEPQPPQSPPPQTPEQPLPPPPEPKRKRRRKWPWVLLVLFLLILAVVGLAPTIASTGAVRSIVVGKVNQNLNGNVEIADWSFGWGGPQTISGVKVYDDQKRLVLDIPRIKLGISLINAAKQNFALGDDNVIDVASFNVIVDETGHTNLERIAKVQPTTTVEDNHTGTPTTHPGEQVVKVPNVSGKFTINFQGTVSGTPGSGIAKPVNVDPSQAIVNITDINKPIEDSIKLAYRVGASGDPSRIDASGSVDAFENNELVDINSKLVAIQKINLSKVDIGAAEPFLKKPMGADTKTGGIANGSLDVNAQGLTGISANGQIEVVNLLFRGGPLKGGDQFKTDKLNIPITITRTVVDPNTTLIKIEKLNVEMPQVAVAVSGQVTEQALQNLGKNQPPGSDGAIKLVADVKDLPNLANQFRNTLQLDKSVEIKGGNVHADTAVTLAKDSVTITNNLTASAQGTRDGKPITIQPITVALNATALPKGTPIPDVRDLKIGLDSAFAKVQGGGSLAKLDIGGNFDLRKLRSELGQFADLGSIQLAGTGDFKIGTNGDVTADNTPITATANVNLNNVKVSGATTQPIDQDHLAINAGGNIQREAGKPIGVDKGFVMVTSGDPKSPLLDVAANANLDLREQGKTKAPWFELVKCTITDLAKLQQQYGGFVPALAEQKLKIEQGAFYAQAAGSYDGTTLTFSKPASISVPSLTVTKEGRPLLTHETIRANLNGKVSTPADGLAANLTELSVTTQSKLFNLTKSGDAPLTVNMKGNAIDGNGQMALAADLKRLMDLAQAFGGQVIVQPNQPQLQSGQFSGTLSLAKAEQTKIDFNGQLSSLTIASNGTSALNNEQITIALNATAPADLNSSSPITATGKIGSSFVNTTISDVKVSMAGGMWDKLQSANLETQVPDLPKLYALMQALAPPAAPAGPAGPQKTAQSEPVIYAMAQDAGPVRGDERISTPRRRPAPQPNPPPEQTPPSAHGGETAPPLPPLQITSGSAMIRASVKRDAASNTTHVNVSDAHVSGLALARGDQKYAFSKDQQINFKLAADVKAQDVAGKSVTEQIQSLKVTQLNADIPGAGGAKIASVTMPTPIDVTNLSAATPTVNGAVQLNGRLDEATPLLAVLQGSPDELPYGGDYSFAENISTQGQQIVLKGDGGVNGLKVKDSADKNKVIFSEDKVSLANDVQLAMDTKTATVRTFSLDMPKSQALAVKFSGKVTDWAQARTITGLDSRIAKMDLSYDLEKLWAIAKPMLSPELREQYKDMPVKGKFNKTFEISGAYPNKPTWQESIATTNMNGSFAVQYVEVPQGLKLEQFEMPFTIRNGLLRIAAAPKSDARKLKNLPPPPAPAKGQQQPDEQQKPSGDDQMADTALCNGGELNLNGIALDLTKPDPLLSVARKHILLRRVALNPVLADTIGHGNLLFKDADEASGFLDVQVVECRNVPLGELIKKSKKNTRAQIVFNVTDLHLDGPVPQVMSQALNLGGKGINGYIKNGMITVDNGQATTDFAVQLAQTGKTKDPRTGREREVTTAVPLKFGGGIDLATQRLRDFAVNIPSELIRDELGGKQLREALPGGIAVPFTGTTDNFKWDIAGTLLKSAPNSILGGGGGQNPLGNLGDLFGGKKKDKNQK